MDIPTIAATQTGKTPVATNTKEQKNALLSSDFETFLKMLTAQARYQDPLEPIDSSEYAAQLAQFSMVEQQVLSNDLLTSLASQLGAGNIGQMAGWIGMEARSTAPAQFNGAPLTLFPTPEAGADQAFLIVRDAAGDEVERAQISTTTNSIDWAGVRGDGSPLPTGLYSFTVESRAEGQVIAGRPAETYARITEARRQGDETVLILGGGSSISAGEISALREPI